MIAHQRGLPPENAPFHTAEPFPWHLGTLSPPLPFNPPAVASAAGLCDPLGCRPLLFSVPSLQYKTTRWDHDRQLQVMPI